MVKSGYGEVEYGDVERSGGAITMRIHGPRKSVRKSVWNIGKGSGGGGKGRGWHGDSAGHAAAAARKSGGKRKK